MQPTPTVSRADVERVVRRDYPADQFAHVMAMLDTYGNDERECDRVKLAALKLAAGNLEELSDFLDGSDSRDLMSWAEYPGYSNNQRVINRLPAAERQQIVDEDRAQYVEWLNRK